VPKEISLTVECDHSNITNRTTSTARIPVRIILFYSPTGVVVGPWEFTIHSISGTISLLNSTTVVIDNFSYDNGGISKLIRW
jgi:hypothetical protein